MNSTALSVGPARLWRWMAALAIFFNIGLNYWSQAKPFNGQSMGAVSAQYPTLLTPAGYAFSIWGLIFTAMAVYAAWQLLPAQHASRLPDAVAKPLVVANLASAAWVVLFAYELIFSGVFTMLVILGALILAYGRARRRVLADKAPRWVSVPLALYLGWISVASVINVTIGLQQLGWQPTENVALVLALGMLAVVVALGLLVSRNFLEMAFPLVVAWALVAIWVARRGAGQYPELAWAALAGAVVVAAGGFVLASRQRRRAAGV